eukprot:SAG22_NODE_379_length_11417_cov_211.325647_2_plen_87_part_00
MRREAMEWAYKMGSQRPWTASGLECSNIYMAYNDADPWTAPGAVRHVPAGLNLTYDLGGGGISHCVYPALGAQPSIRAWAAAAVDE